VPSLSIVIPVKNEAGNLDACLRSIADAASRETDYEVLVIDNGSDDDTVSVARQHGATVFVLPGATVAGLRNHGAKEANGDLLAFIDADCTVASDWFAAIEPYYGQSEVHCFGSPPGIPRQSTWVQECWYQIRKKGAPSDQPHPVEWLESMNLFARRTEFHAVGGFDTQLITCEDYDLCLRLGESSEIICDPAIRAIHHGEAADVKRFYSKERWRGVSNLAGLRRHGFRLSELPSLLFPLVQLAAILFVVVGGFLSLLGVFSAWWVVVGIVAWQLPLLMLSYRKSQRSQRLKQTGGIWALLNVYFTARGQSLFLGAAWR
jgi:glycosyltransferase involved in cell wall biosynthesis